LGKIGVHLAKHTDCDIGVSSHPEELEIIEVRCTELPVLIPTLIGLILKPTKPSCFMKWTRRILIGVGRLSERTYFEQCTPFDYCSASFQLAVRPRSSAIICQVRNRSAELWSSAGRQDLNDIVADKVGSLCYELTYKVRFRESLGLDTIDLKPFMYFNNNGSGVRNYGQVNARRNSL
jgi:hypothetical protein